MVIPELSIGEYTFVFRGQVLVNETLFIGNSLNHAGSVEEPTVLQGLFPLNKVMDSMLVPS